MSNDRFASAHEMVREYQELEKQMADPSIHEDQGKAALFTVVMAGFLEAQKLEEGHGFFQVFDADHGVKILDLHVAPRWMFQAHTIVATRAASRLKV